MEYIPKYSNNVINIQKWKLFSSTKSAIGKYIHFTFGIKQCKIELEVPNIHQALYLSTQAFLEKDASKESFDMKKRKQIRLPRPMPLALRILQWELPLIMLWSVALLITLLQSYSSDPLGASHAFMDSVEYIGASLVLSCMTAVLADLILREQQKREE